MNPIRHTLTFIMLAIILGGCGESGGETVTEGRLSMALPDELWHADCEITDMLTLKHGVDHPDAVARLYFSGWDTDEVTDDYAMLELRLREAIDRGDSVEYLGPVEVLSEPYTGVSLSYNDRLGIGEYYNQDSLFYCDGRYVVLDSACELETAEELREDFELLRSSVTVAPPPPWRAVGDGGQLSLDDLSLTVEGDGWEVREEETSVLLRRGEQRLHCYKRHPHSGTGEGFDLLDGLRKEIESLNLEPSFIGEPVVRETPCDFAALTYTTGDSRRYDAVLLYGKSFYLIDAVCPSDVAEEVREELSGMVEGISTAKPSGGGE